MKLARALFVGVCALFLASTVVATPADDEAKGDGPGRLL